jgi:GT2 family glycosyltransferase
MKPRPDLCVIILSYRNEATVLRSLESLLDQNMPLEIVVSHSGGGPTPSLLGPYLDRVHLIESSSRRMPGAARNAGIEATIAPWISFLAADCMALPGWAAGRMERHRRGSPAVASAMAPPVSARAAIVSYLLQHSSRMSHLDSGARHYHGLSYSRDVLERYGPFAEDLRQGEDTMLNRRLIRAGIPIAWAPDVLTSHDYPTTAASLLADCWRRGRRRAGLFRAPHQRIRLLAQVGLEGPLALSRCARPGSPVRLHEWLACLPLLAAGEVATTLGVLRGQFAEATSVAMNAATESPHQTAPMRF